MRSTIHGVRIVDVVGVVPAQVAYFDDEVPNYRQDAASSAKLKAVMGYNTHRLAPPGTTVSALATRGIRHLLARGRVATDEIGALVIVTQTPDHPLPATSSIIHGMLGLPDTVYCADINDGCNGFIKGMHQVSMLIANSDIECAILVTGDVLSQRTSPYDRNSFPLIGDAVAVTVVRKDGGAHPLHFDLRNDGRGFEAIMIPAGGSRAPATPERMERKIDDEGNARSATELVMQGREVFTFTQTVVPRFLEGYLEWIGQPAKMLGRLYLHQANAFILDRLRKRFSLDATQVPDQVVRTYGNSSSATIPMAIAADAEPRDGRAVACGFGVGLAWGAVDIDLSGLVCSEIIELGDINV